jgi:hypothetical protein
LSISLLRSVVVGSALLASTALAQIKELNTTVDLGKLPAGLKFKGTAQSGLSWKDNNGENYVIFSVTAKKDAKGLSSVYLYADHFAIKDSKVTVLRNIKDTVEKCEFDNVAKFLDNSFEVTDLDSDGLGEISFAYTLDCVSDVSPVALKVLLLENKNKYIARGTTEVNYGDGVVGGTKTPDAALKKAPKAFQEQVDALWNKIKRR